MLKFMMNAPRRTFTITHKQKYIHSVIKTMNYTQETNHRNV